MHPDLLLSLLFQWLSVNQGAGLTRRVHIFPLSFALQK